MQVHRPVSISYKKNIVLLSMHPSPIKDMPIMFVSMQSKYTKGQKKGKGGVVFFWVGGGGHPWIKHTSISRISI